MLGIVSLQRGQVRAQRAAAIELRGQRIELVVDHEELRLGVLQQIFEARRTQLRIDGHPHEPAQVQRVDQMNMLGTVAEHHGDAIALHETVLAKPALQSRDLPGGLFAGDRAILEMHDGARRIAAQSCCKQRRTVEFVV